MIHTKKNQQDVSIYGPQIHKYYQGRGGRVMRSRLRGWRVPNSNENPPCIWTYCTLNHTQPNILPLVWCGSLGRGGSSGASPTSGSGSKLRVPSEKPYSCFRTGY
ncbi:hypothetical protein AVEN_204702-1 [Araneus ventricosus]|uniref:Uncharacterized protein n=1 Tax=Araneus ventricosus TaxID=182803 RepID=A0A4Y2GH84_ARAVE|nr:hypothetical protein AVEN_204702-1 [Araneus ventricosus]